ncbi:MAG: Fic family protein [Paludibacteraceae bacterium]|nr:Fic family protein [Paludibacteraceae bacterium]
MDKYIIPTLPLSYDLETKAVLKQLNRANSKLSELKGLSHTIPNEKILISTLTLQEAKDSSEVENIITTQDDLYKAGLEYDDSFRNPSAKEVLNYKEAVLSGFENVKKKGFLSLNIIKDIQTHLEHNRAGFRNVPGTKLKRSDDVVVYTPPQDYDEIVKHMSNLECFINTADDGIDPLIKMAIIHHQFESIHPFFDGNGRTGRIINVLYLVMSGSLDLPILYLSRFITHNKEEYYRLIQAIRDKEGDNSKEWENWILFILRGVEETSLQTIQLVNGISALMADYKVILKRLFEKQYRHELINNLFFHPYTKIDFLEKDLDVSRQTAAKYLKIMVDEGLLECTKLGKYNYYINRRLFNLFLNVSSK